MLGDKTNNFAKKRTGQMEGKDFNKLFKNFSKKLQKKDQSLEKEGRDSKAERKDLKKVKIGLSTSKDIKQRQMSLERKRQKLSAKLHKGHRRIVSNDLVYSSNAIQIVKIRPETGSNEGVSEKGYAKLASLVSSPFKKGYTLQNSGSTKKPSTVVSYKNIIAKHRRVHSNFLENYGSRAQIAEGGENEESGGKNYISTNYSKKLSEFRNKFKDLTFSKKDKKGAKGKKKKKKTKKKTAKKSEVILSSTKQSAKKGDRNATKSLLKDIKSGKYFSNKLNSLFSFGKSGQKKVNKHRRIQSNDFMNYFESNKRLDRDKFKSPTTENGKKSTKKDLKFKYESLEKKSGVNPKLNFTTKVRRKAKNSTLVINKSEITKKGSQSTQIEKNKVYDSSKSWKMGIKAKKILNSLRVKKENQSMKVSDFKNLKINGNNRKSLTSKVLKIFKDDNRQSVAARGSKDSDHIRIKDELKKQSKHVRGHHRKNAHSMPFSDPTNQIIQMLKLPINLGKKDFTMTPDISMNKTKEQKKDKSPTVTKFLPRNDSSLVSLIQVNEEVENNEIGINEIVRVKAKTGRRVTTETNVNQLLQKTNVEISIQSEFKYSRNEKGDENQDASTQSKSKNTSKTQLFFNKEITSEKNLKPEKSKSKRKMRNSENRFDIVPKKFEKFESRKSSYKYSLTKSGVKLLNSSHKRSESNYNFSKAAEEIAEQKHQRKKTNRLKASTKPQSKEKGRTLSCSQRRKESLHRKMKSIDRSKIEPRNKTKDKKEKSKARESKRSIKTSSSTMPLILQRLILQNKIRELFRESDDDLVTTLEFYQFKRLLGEGSFGKVYSAVNILTEKEVAIKCFDKAKVKTDSAKRKIFQEVKILRMLDHNNVTRLLEVFENRKFIFFVMEYAEEGDILKLLKEKGPLDEHIARFLTIQIIHGLQYCHSKRVLHRDIKLDNVLLSKGFIAKICDFGVSCILKENQILHEQCGTPAYIAPEVIKGDGYSSFQPDVWNLAILLYAMVTGTVPFKSNSIDELHELILIGDYEFPQDTEMSDELKDLLTKMIILDPKKRIDLEGMLLHPWFKPITKHKNLEFMDKKEEEEPSKIIRKLIQLGFPKDQIEISLEHQILNHIYACYHLLREKN